MITLRITDNREDIRKWTGLPSDNCDEALWNAGFNLDVWNLKNIYAVCSKHGITFEPFEDDTRTCFCSWGERREP